MSFIEDKGGGKPIKFIITSYNGELTKLERAGIQTPLLELQDYLASSPEPD